MVTKNKKKEIVQDDPQSILKDIDSLDNQFEVMDRLMKVHSGLKNKITSDYTLARLNRDEKVFMQENYKNAVFALNLIMPCDRDWETE